MGKVAGRWEVCGDPWVTVAQLNGALCWSFHGEVGLMVVGGRWVMSGGYWVLSIWFFVLGALWWRVAVGACWEWSGKKQDQTNSTDLRRTIHRRKTKICPGRSSGHPADQ